MIDCCDLVMLATPPGLPAPAHRGHDQGRQAALHREAGRRRRHRHPQGAGRLRGGQQEGPVGRHRHPAPPPGRLHREHEANPRRCDRRPRRRPRLLEPGRHLGAQAPGRLERHRVPDPQLVPLPLALRRPHRRAARPQPRRGLLGARAPPGPRRRHGRPPGDHRARARPELRPLRRRLRVPQRRPRPEHVPSDRRLREQRLGDDRRHQGPVAQRRVSLHRRVQDVASASSTRSTPTSRSTSTCSRASSPTSRSTS